MRPCRQNDVMRLKKGQQLKQTSGFKKAGPRLYPRVSYGFAPCLPLQECIRMLEAQRATQITQLESVRTTDTAETCPS